MPSKPLNAIVISGALALALAAPAAPAAVLPSPTHPVHATAAMCDVSARVALRAYRTFDVRADRINCGGVLASRVIQPRSAAHVTGRAVPSWPCGWRVEAGKLKLTIATASLDGPWTKVVVPFRTDNTGPAATLSGSAKAGDDAISYAGLVSLVPAPSVSSQPRSCVSKATLSFDLSLSTKPDGSGS